MLATNDGVIWRAFINSAILTVASVALMVILAAMAGYVLARAEAKWNPVVNFFVLAGLIVPPAVVPTIWVLQGLELFGTMPGMILIEATFGLSFSILLFRAFVGTIPARARRGGGARRRRPVPPVLPGRPAAAPARSS